MSMIQVRTNFWFCFTSLVTSLASTIVLAQATAPAPIQYLEGHEAPVHAVGYSPDGKILFSGDTSGTLKMWDRLTGQLLSSGQWHEGAILALAISPDGQQVISIEGLADKGKLHAVQQAWIDHQVPQCGYCQGGQILAAVALLKKKPQPSDQDIDAAMTNICRCGTYARMRTAIHAAARQAGGQS